MPGWKKRKAPSNFQKICVGEPSIVVKALSGKPVMEMKLNSAILVYIARWLQ